MNNKPTKKLYFIDTSLPGDEGKYFKYILLSENNSRNISTGSSPMSGKKIQTQSTYIQDLNIAIQNPKSLAH